MKAITMHALRIMALWLGMIAGTIASGILIHQVRHAGLPDGPISVTVALLLVNALGALVVAALASRLEASGLWKFAILLVVIFTVETGLSSIESAAFGQALGLSHGAVAAIAAAGMVRAIVTAAVATLLWPRSSGAVHTFAPGAVRPALLVAAYLLLYFGAGLFAWRSEAVRDFYRGGVDFDLWRLSALQIVRGLLWVGLAMLLSARLRGPTISVSLLAGATFAVLMAAPLLYPNAMMPWSVRQVHLIELAASNALFGCLAIATLRSGRTTPSPGGASALPGRRARAG